MAVFNGIHEQENSICPDNSKGKGSRNAKPGEWDVFIDKTTGQKRRLVGVAWAHKKSASEAALYGEALMGDEVKGTNDQRRPMYDIITVGPDGKNIVVIEVILLNETMRLYSWIFWDVIPNLIAKSSVSECESF